MRSGLQHIGCIYIMCLFVRELLDVHATETKVEITSVTSAKPFIIRDEVSSRDVIRR